MTTYTLGFLFDVKSKEVALIKKNRPEWQKNKWNGIGGHIESKEMPIDCVIREFFEETGVIIKSWEFFGEIQTSSAIIYMFKSFCDKKLIKELRTVTDEEVRWHKINCLYNPEYIDNLSFIIPAALCVQNPQITINN